MSPSPYLSDTPARRKPVLTSSLLKRIQKVCDPTLVEFDQKAALDVAKYINGRGEPSTIAATARDTVTCIVKLINCRDVKASLYALNLLDVLVRNCGVAVHFVISRREFLNALVRRFPEQPPLRYTKVQKLILTSIEMWYQSICKHAYYKSDLVCIRDMRRLLKFKGYMFPNLKDEVINSMKPVHELRTFKELYQEQEIRQSLQLDDYIRKGGEENLKRANELMKVMAGFTDDNKKEARNCIKDELVILKDQLDVLDNIVMEKEEDMENDADHSQAVRKLQQTIEPTVRDLVTTLKNSQRKIPIILREEQEDNGGEDTELLKELLDFNERVTGILSHIDIPETGNTIKLGVLQSTPDSEMTLLDLGTSEGHTVRPREDNNVAIGMVPDLIDEPMLIDHTRNSQNVIPTGFNFGNGISLKSSKPTNPIVTMSVARDHSTDIFGRYNNLIRDRPVTTDLIASDTGSTSSRNILSRDNTLKIEYTVHNDGDSALHLDIYFNNETGTEMTDVEFSLAVPKSFSLQMYPQSGTSIQPFGRDSITQQATITSQMPQRRRSLRVKWKVTYRMSGTKLVEESDIFTLLNVFV